MTSSWVGTSSAVRINTASSAEAGIESVCVSLRFITITCLGFVIRANTISHDVWNLCQPLIFQYIFCCIFKCHTRPKPLRFASREKPGKIAAHVTPDVTVFRSSSITEISFSVVINVVANLISEMSASDEFTIKLRDWMRPSVTSRLQNSKLRIRCYPSA